MQFKFQLLLTFIFAAFALATPAAQEAQKIKAREAAMNELMDGVLESRADISSFLGQLTGLLPALLQLLNAQTLNNIKGLVDNAAALLAAPFVNQTRSTIAQASSLLGGLGPLLDGLPDLLDAVGPLLANIGPLLSSLGGLLTPELIQKVGGLLDAVFSLLTPEFIAQISGLISDVAPVIAALMRLLNFLFSFDFSAPGNQGEFPGGETPAYNEDDYTYKPGEGLVYTPGKGGPANDPKIGPGHGVDDGAGTITFDDGSTLDYTAGADTSGGDDTTNSPKFDWGSWGDSTPDTTGDGTAGAGGAEGGAGGERGAGDAGSDGTEQSSDTSATSSGSSQMLPLSSTLLSILTIASGHFLVEVLANL